LLDENKFTDIVEKYYKQILYYCTGRYYIDISDAEEITNDVFIILFRKWDSLAFDEIRAWLHRTADNLVMHHFRKKKTRVKTEPLYDNDTEELVADDYEKDIVSEDFVSRILNKLSDEEQKIFECRYITGLTLMEIAKLMGIPYSTVRLRLMGIQKKIRNYLM